jgi:23S rRNA (cytosine1962-C5)-methyltransferase
MPEPAEADHLPVLRLKRDEDRRLIAGHLWVFSNEVDTRETPLTRFEPGALARVLAHNDRDLGVAYVNPHSLISARLLETRQLPDTAWLVVRLRGALRLRERLFGAPYYRLAHGESDGLPGLIVDRYGAQAVAQIGTSGMERLKSSIAAALGELGFETVLFKNDAAARELEGLPSYVEAARGAMPAHLEVVEDALTFEIPFAAGQKTGWFFDQSANRAALGRFIKPGDRVLDAFSYVGAWGVRAASAGARVTCLDSAQSALEAALANARRNALTLDTHRGDAFEELERLAAQGARFEAIVLDPPAFAKRRKELPKALAAYKRLNQLALQLLMPEGTLISCSCSHHVSAEDLEQAIARAARSAGRRVQILMLGGQAVDHPVHPAIPETRYLKAYFCRVSDGLK